MPFYEYHCAANGRTVEVRHGMAQTLRTWGEVAQAAGTEAGETAIDAPVERIMSASIPLTGSPAPAQGCGSGCGCYPQA